MCIDWSFYYFDRNAIIVVTAMDSTGCHCCRKIAKDCCNCNIIISMNFQQQNTYVYFV